jgi:hypothetical protein
MAINKNKDTDINFTTGDNYTHAVLLNTVMPRLTVPRKNVIGLAFEPRSFLNISPAFIQYCQRNVGAYYIGETTDLPEPFVAGHGYMWRSPLPDHTPVKKRVMSVIITNRLITAGHRYRHRLVRWISDKNLPIDIYGHGSTSFSGDYIKGPFEDYAVYTDYIFTICVENTKCDEYISEKIIGPLVNDCIPIYYGCNNISKHFPGQVIELNGDFTHDTELILDILKNPNTYTRTITSTENSEYMNLLGHVKDLFK